jgi:N-acetylglucosaminyl-diphospho-decaprenol L-rhamnosyltransferase
MAVSVSAIVVNYQTADLTLEAVRSVVTDPGVEEVVVVDNGSKDGSADSLRAHCVSDKVRIVVSRKNLGFGGGVNLGVRQASGELLFLINSDAVLEPGSLAGLIDLMEKEPGTAIAAPLVIGPDDSPQVDAYGEFPTLKTMVLRRNRHPDDVLRPDWVSGVAMLVRRSAFEEIDGFDPDFHMYLEDVDLCRRMRSAGWDIARVLEARIRHLSGASSTPRARGEAYRESLLRFYEKDGASKFEVGILGIAHRGWSLISSGRS